MTKLNDVMLHDYVERRHVQLHDVRSHSLTPRGTTSRLRTYVSNHGETDEEGDEADDQDKDLFAAAAAQDVRVDVDDGSHEALNAHELETKGHSMQYRVMFDNKLPVVSLYSFISANRMIWITLRTYSVPGFRQNFRNSNTFQ